LINRLFIRHGLFLVFILLLCVSALPGPDANAQQGEIAITIGTTDFPRSIDPASAFDYPSWELMAHLYTGLTRQIPGTLTYELALAADHYVSEDGLLHTFTIRPDARFSDGTPITAATFVESINRVITLGRDPADFVNRYIAAVTEADGNSVQFTLHIPLPDFEALIALPPFYPQHPDIFPPGDLLDSTNTATIIGNGAYRLEGFQPGQQAVLVPDPSFDGLSPLNNRIIIRHYELPIDLRRAILGHEIDVAWRALAPPDLDAIQAAPQITIRQQPNLQVFYLLFNHEQTTLNNAQSFDDPAVREAFAQLIDRERVAERGFDGTVAPLYSLLPPQFGLGAVSYPSYDVQQADAVLTEAGYRPLRRPVQASLYISTDTYGDLMNDAAQELRRSIEASEIASITFIQNDLTATFTRVIYRGEYFNAIIGWRPPFASPAGYLIPLAHSTARIPAAAGYSSDEIDALLEAAALADDNATREGFYEEVQRLLLEDYALVPLWQGQDMIAFWNDITGVELEYNSWLHYETLARQ